MPLPTRRAVRPDGKHIRDARRQRLSRPNQSRGARGFWMIIAILSLAGLIVSGAAQSLSVQHHAWIMPVLYTSVAGLIIALVALFI